MMSFIGSRKVVAQFADEVLKHSGKGFQSITITRLDTSGDFYVSIVTDTSSEEIVKMLARIYSSALLRILPENTQDG